MRCSPAHVTCARTREGIRAVLAFAADALHASVAHPQRARRVVRFVADESIAGATVYALRAAGLSVLFIAETAPGSAKTQPFPCITHRASNRSILTAEKDCVFVLIVLW